METPQADFLREDTARRERWAHLTEGMTDDVQTAVIETLMDNTKAMVEGRLTGVPFLRENTSTADVAAFNRVAYSMIRRIYPALVSNGLVSIQPTKLPVTLVHFLDFLYDTTQSPTVAGDRLDYSAGKFNKHYSAGVIRDEGLGTGDAATTDFTLDHYPVRAGSETIYVDSVATSAYTLDEATGTVSFDVAPANAAVLTADYAIVQEATDKIPSLKLTMASAQVGTEERRIKAEWTLEGQQDLSAYHNLSMEKELVRAMSDEIRRELDRTIIADLYDAAAAGAATATWDSNGATADYKKSEWIETLVHKMNDVSNEIYKLRFRHANFAIMHPDVQNTLDRLNTFRSLTFGKDGALPTADISVGAAVVGTLASRYRVIVDPLAPRDKILMGYKGNSWAETGYVFAPYAAFRTATVLDPHTLKQVKAIMTRDGRHLVNSEFYGEVTLQNF